MKNKFSYLFLTCTSFFVIYLLFYILDMNEDLYILIFANKINVSHIVVFLFCAFYITFLLLIKEKQKVEIVAKIIKNKDKIILAEQKRLEEKLHNEIELSKNKDKLVYEDLKIVSMKELISNISHQYRQPLSMISMAATSLKLYNEKKLLDKDKIIETCTQVNENVQYLSSILDSFEELTSIDKKKSIFRLSSIRYKLISFIDMYKRSSDIDISFTTEDDISVLSYKSELIQALLNIINNSREALAKKELSKRYIQVDIQNDATHFMISIKDNAGGIDESIIDRVFEPYLTTKHKAQGVGLGLYISYVLITQKLKGEVSVSNTSEGCEFILRIPRT